MSTTIPLQTLVAAPAGSPHPQVPPPVEATPALQASEPVYVTRPSLPPLEEFLPYLEGIWEQGILTNNGPYHRQFEARLAEYLGVQHLSLFANGTLALLTALQALRITGEVITTPYSFVATSHALLWNRLEPVFVDVDPVTLNLDPARIEAAITPRTTAILPVHCYGRPCAVEEIQAIADRHGLKVLYDAAHAFGVEDAGGSILRHGDLSILSLHATKVFNTFEGGAIISPDAETKRHIDNLKNFGFVNETTVVAPGINGKMSEVNAAFGLLQLQHIDRALEARKRLAARYVDGLAGVRGITLVQSDAARRNHAYFPILVGADFPLSREALYAMLKSAGIHARRYFYPLISSFPMYRHLASADPAHLPCATAASESVICLPLYPDLPTPVQDRIIELVATAAMCGAGDARDAA
jgi:Predicted pyridoxal phosphate-dependent enzyme apparently involved in regulation of cell wall biogenesis